MRFGVNKTLQELIKKDNVKCWKRKFYEERRSVICGIVTKLFGRGPILCKMVRFITVYYMLYFLLFINLHYENEWKVCRFRSWIIRYCLLVSFMDYKILSSFQCDSVVVEFKNSYDDNFFMLRSLFEDFNKATDRLDIVRHWLLWWS